MAFDLKRRLLVVTAALLFSVAAHARAPHNRLPAASQPNEAQLVEHGNYINKSGREVHSPAHSKSGSAPAGASAQCRDGTYSFSQHRSGTCSRHGGVANWL
jgi:hypothetical protein